MRSIDFSGFVDLDCEVFDGLDGSVLLTGVLDALDDLEVVIGSAFLFGVTPFLFEEFNLLF